jgi:ABC-2 type transport system ATP-binding protein
MAFLKAEAFSYNYGNRRVLRDVSFSLGEGEILGILGINGAGKSTLMRLLSGRVALQKGRIFFRGDAIAGPGTITHSSMRKQCGVVFQDSSLDKKLNAWQNLRFSSELYGFSWTAIEPRARALLMAMSLHARANERVQTYSGGMARRLELVRAMLHEPRLLIMDEPSSGLDLEGFDLFWQFLRSQKQSRQLSAIISTHRFDEAELVDRLIVLHDGQIIAQGSPAELRSKMRGDRVIVQFSLQAFDDEKEKAVQLLSSKLGSDRVLRIDASLHISVDDGPAFVPEVVHMLPPGLLSEVAVRKPSLQDVFRGLVNNSSQEALHDV